MVIPQVIELKFYSIKTLLNILSFYVKLLLDSLESFTFKIIYVFIYYQSILL